VRGRRPRLRITLIVGVGTVFVTTASLLGQPRDAADDLLALYERGAYDTFDERVRPFGALPVNVNAFTRAADRWSGSGANRERRRLIAAAAAVELAAVLRDWDRGPVLLDAGRNWVKSSDDSETVRQWYRAALGAALRHGDANALLTSEDVGQTYGSDAYRGYSNESLRRFGDDPVLLLYRAIAFEMHWGVAAGPVEWLDRDAVERQLQLIRRAAEQQQLRRFPPAARMDAPSAVRLLGRDVVDLSNVSVVAEISLRLWRVASMFEELQRNPVTASEASVRLALTYDRLARPDWAAREFERMRDVPASPFVTYLVHFLRGRHFASAGRPQVAEVEYASALRAVPGAQSAVFALASLLFDSGRRAEAERLVAGALRTPLAEDPIKDYGAGDPSHLRDALAQLRRRLR
jgi:hypothetical protein